MGYYKENLPESVLAMFQDEIKRWRVKRNFTIEQMAESMGVSTVTYSKWENGKTSPKAEQIPRLADKLGTSINSLFGREIQERDEQIKVYLKMAMQLTDEDKQTLEHVIAALLHKSNAERAHDMEQEMFDKRLKEIERAKEE
ncbi:helix-turn-helix domain-containing protein [Photobacterium sp. WH24]|uniref:helix-turn-helix domain-containing protein n=1 Tax=Photobacterium sp. WH24 TaxID=2827237 RepID=UPI001C474F09|nr:helix-turn-helix domain-containing protein [Photobacterium sp. WH24]MBV7264527.1 helix-turn-helix domain-containing protein [Photobacterium sp. WH24]